MNTPRTATGRSSPCGETARPLTGSISCPRVIPSPQLQVDLSSELLGVKMKFPMMVGPSSGQNQLHPEGEIGMFKGAAAAGMVDILAGATNSSAKAALTAVPGGTLWTQHYPIENLANMQKALEGVQDAGATNIIVTIDQQASVYERTLRISTGRPPNPRRQRGRRQCRRRSRRRCGGQGRGRRPARARFGALPRQRPAALV